jgi:hypothetical protein
MIRFEFLLSATLIIAVAVMVSHYGDMLLAEKTGLRRI